MDEVRVKAELVKSETEQTVTLKLDKDRYEILRELAKQKGWKEGSAVSVTFEAWSDERSERAFNLFHKIRDRLAECMGIQGSSEKAILKAELKAEYGVIQKIGGRPMLKSTNRYTVKEMMKLIDGVIMGPCNDLGAEIADLLAERRELK